MVGFCSRNKLYRAITAQSAVNSGKNTCNTAAIVRQTRKAISKKAKNAQSAKTEYMDGAAKTARRIVPVIATGKKPKSKQPHNTSYVRFFVM